MSNDEDIDEDEELESKDKLELEEYDDEMDWSMCAVQVSVSWLIQQVFLLLRWDAKLYGS